MIFKSSKSDLLGLNGSSPLSLVDQLFHAYFYRRRKMQMILRDFVFDLQLQTKFATSFNLQSKPTHWTEVKNWAEQLNFSWTELRTENWTKKLYQLTPQLLSLIKAASDLTSCFAQLGRVSKTCQKLDEKNREIDRTYLCLQRFDNFWV